VIFVLRERAVCTWHFLLVEKGANGGRKTEFGTDRRPPQCWPTRISAANKKAPCHGSREGNTAMGAGTTTVFSAAIHNFIIYG
jgi:hypothetical protein